jgi:hypothetical protein
MYDHGENGFKEILKSFEFSFLTHENRIGKK